MKHSDERRKTRRGLIERFGATCWICGEPINLSLPRDHDEAFTVDHVIPRSLGGKGLHNNTRPAHKVCNQARGRFHEKEVL